MGVMNLLAASDFILPGILLALLLFSAILGFVRKSKYTQENEKMKKELKAGDKIKTYAGIYGEIVEVKEANDGSFYAIIKTGEDDKVSYMSIDLEAVYSYDFKDEKDDEVIAELPKEEITLNGEAIDTNEATIEVKKSGKKTSKKTKDKAEN